MNPAHVDFEELIREVLVRYDPVGWLARGEMPEDAYGQEEIWKAWAFYELRD